MLKRILVLLGETAASVNARDYAFRLAHKTGAELAGLAGIDLSFIEAPLPGAIGATGARRVIVTHGSVPVMVRYLTEQGLQAEAFETEYGDDRLDEPAPEQPPAAVQP